MRRWLAAGTVAVALGAAGASTVEAGCNSRACEIRVARKQCDRGSVKACIRRAALHRRQDYGAMLRVAWCESRFNPRAVSPWGHVGLYQFAWGTWRTTPYARHSPFSAKWAALAAAWMWQQGRKREWACQ